MNITCKLCEYSWDSKHKRPNPRFITCPNCRGQVELRPSKLADMGNTELSLGDAKNG